VFRGIRVQWDKDSNRVLLRYRQNKKGDYSKPESMQVVPFVKDYLLLPNKSTSLRWSKRGFFRKSEKGFQPVMDEALKLKDIGRTLMDQPVEVMGLPIKEIKKRALEFRKCIDDGDEAGLKDIFNQYRRLPRKFTPVPDYSKEDMFD
jgi:hypothetical protein